MNMAVPIQRAYPEVEKRSQGPQTVVGRLREWSRVQHWDPVNCFPPTSTAAGWRNPGRATDTDPDGGMSERMDKLEVALPPRIRAREVEAALRAMPAECCLVIRAMYQVPRREEERSERSAAELLKIGRVECARRVERAFGWLERDLGLPRT